MLVALGVMVVTMVALAAVFATVQNDATFTSSNLDGKRAYSAAEAGLQAYLGQLNENASASTWWQTCANDTASNVAVPGTTGETYSYQPVVNQTDSPTNYCAQNGAIGTVVDPSVGLLRMEFTGSAGSYGAARTIVADFRPITPLAYLWYTVHETANPNVSGNSSCPSGSNDYANSNVPSNCWIYWANGDQVNGPMYTQDQFLIKSGSTPLFGRSGGVDQVASPNSSLCVVDSGGSQPVPYTQGTTCPSGIVQGKAAPNVSPTVPLPSDNANLVADAGSYGVTLPPGTTTLTLSQNGGTTTGLAITCQTSTSCVKNTYNLTNKPVIAATSVSSTSCTSGTAYNPAYVTYNQVGSGTYSGDYYGACGDLYVSGTYGSSLTATAAGSVIVSGNLLNSTDANGSTNPSGNATLGLVANSFVRIGHPVSFQYNNQGQPTSCSGTAPNLTVDAAILALNQSFTVDNYECGSTGTLTIHGSIAQEYRGAVATSNGNGGVGTGYQKNYVYDPRLKIILPAYLFDLQNTSWDVVRETTCSPGQPSSSTQSCAYTGNNG